MYTRLPRTPSSTTMLVSPSAKFLTTERKYTTGMRKRPSAVEQLGLWLLLTLHGVERDAEVVGDLISDGRLGALEQLERLSRVGVHLALVEVPVLGGGRVRVPCRLVTFARDARAHFGRRRGLGMRFGRPAATHETRSGGGRCRAQRERAAGVAECTTQSVLYSESVRVRASAAHGESATGSSRAPGWSGYHEPKRSRVDGVCMHRSECRQYRTCRNINPKTFTQVDFKEAATRDLTALTFCFDLGRAIRTVDPV